MATRDRDSDRDRPGRSREPGGRRSERDEEREGIRGRLEGMVPEIVKRAMLSGLGAVFVTEETIRSAVSDMPKDAVNFLVQSADNTKEQLFVMIAREVRAYLESADLNAEMAKLLSRVTVEVRTQIKFVPNPDAQGEAEPGDLRPEIKNDVQVKRKKPPR